MILTFIHFSATNISIFVYIYIFIIYVTCIYDIICIYIYMYTVYIYIYIHNVCDFASFFFIWGGGPSSATSAFIPFPAVQEFNETFYMPIPQAAKGREMKKRERLKKASMSS